jgi:sigma-B regulation protein RsbU (phosphoserine phosphatase)
MVRDSGRFYLTDQALAILRGQLADIIFGSVFLFIGLTVSAIAGIRRRGGMRIFAWLGIWSALYGAMQLSQSQAIVTVLPHGLQSGAQYAKAAMTYLLLVAGLLSFRELSLGKLRWLIQATACAGVAIFVTGVTLFAFSGPNRQLELLDSLLGVFVLVTLTVVVAAPGLSRKYLVLPDRGVLAAGTLVFAIEALYNSLSQPLGFKNLRVLDHLGFGTLLFSFAYVALRLVLANEHRLLAVENELAVAREIQKSILPGSVPELNGVRISAAYHPMTAVAGDFYEFIPVDRNRAGFLVADVCGHGVPAALIASMLKVCVHMVVPCANDPGAVLRGLNRVLSGLLRGQLVSAAYLWLDTENRLAMYAAAGHPALLRWRNDELQRIESNGLLFGVRPEFADYPVCTMQILSGDRFLLYTDGVTEPENADGDSFGDKRLENVLRGSQVYSPAELSDRMLAEIRQWQPASNSQQDDITLIIIDAI